MNGILLIGEVLNSSRPWVKRIFADRDESAFLSLARAQVEGGASILDLNASMLMEGEGEALQWGCRIVRDRLRLPVMIDSADVNVLKDLTAAFGPDAIANSIIADEETLEELLPLVSRAGAGVVVMLKDRRGVPDSIEGKVALARRAVDRAAKHGIAPDKLYLDPVFTPVATSSGGLLATLEGSRSIGEHFPAHRRIGGLSNISFGLPERRLLNRAFASMAILSGISALICDTNDRELVTMIRASEALVGLDPHCRRFLASYRMGSEPH